MKLLTFVRWVPRSHRL